MELSTLSLDLAERTISSGVLAAVKFVVDRVSFSRPNGLWARVWVMYWRLLIRPYHRLLQKPSTLLTPLGQPWHRGFDSTINHAFDGNVRGNPADYFQICRMNPVMQVEGLYF